MCILCDDGVLELLTKPRERLAPGELAGAVRTAREAAGPGVIDRAAAVLRGETAPEADADFYRRVVVDRAREAGVAGGGGGAGWTPARGTQIDGSDPRVSAFLSSCAEIMDEYRALEAERRQVLERFLEAHGGGVDFASLGRDGELWFTYGGDSYVVLTQAEARTIAERELSARLHTMQPDDLLRYTALPDIARDTLSEIRAKPPETANTVLADLVDLAVLADDQVRASGYAPFFEPESSGPSSRTSSRPAEDLRFGEWVIIRVPGS